MSISAKLRLPSSSLIQQSDPKQGQPTNNTSQYSLLQGYPRISVQTTYETITSCHGSMAQCHTAAFTLAFPPASRRLVFIASASETRTLSSRGSQSLEFAGTSIMKLKGSSSLGTSPISLLFSITLSQGFNRDSRNEFQDHGIVIEYRRISADRAGPSFTAKSRNEVRPLQDLHIRGVFPVLSHLVDFWRPFSLVKLPWVC